MIFMKTYVMQGYFGKIHLFLRSDFTNPLLKLMYFLFPLIGWHRKTVEKIYHLKGNHFTILQEPYVQVLADELDILFCLGKKQRNESTTVNSIPEFIEFEA